MRGAIGWAAALALAAPASAIDPAARALALQAKAQASAGIIGLHNATPANLAHWRKAKAQVLAGVASASLCMIGDSTTAGIGPGNPGRPKSFPSYLVRKFNGVGLSARSESWWGMAGQSSVAAYSAYDPRIAFGTGWAAGGNTLGGAIATASSSVTTALAFTPTSAVDTVDIYYQQGSGFGTFTVDVGGAALATVNSGSPTTAALVKVTVALGAVGTPTINVKRNGTGGAIYIAGMVARNGAVAAIDVLNMGWGSSTTTLWNDASFPARPRAAIATVAPALCAINLGINDRTDSYAVSIDVYRANLAAWADTLLAQGTDVILMVPIPSSSARSSLAQQAAYNQVIRDVATLKGVAWIDMTEVWTSYDAQNALTYYADQVHVFEAGYADEADLVFRVLQRF